MKTISLLFIACLLCACGQKGALYLAPKETALPSNTAPTDSNPALGESTSNDNY